MLHFSNLSQTPSPISLKILANFNYSPAIFVTIQLFDIANFQHFVGTHHGASSLYYGYNTLPTDAPWSVPTLRFNLLAFKSFAE